MINSNISITNELRNLETETVKGALASVSRTLHSQTTFSPPSFFFSFFFFRITFLQAIWSFPLLKEVCESCQEKITWTSLTQVLNFFFFSFSFFLSFILVPFASLPPPGPRAPFLSTASCYVLSLSPLIEFSSSSVDFDGKITTHKKKKKKKEVKRQKEIDKSPPAGPLVPRHDGLMSGCWSLRWGNGCWCA